MTTKKYCSRKYDMPTVEHYAIIEFSTVYTPGDERSRTNPGHGYPESWDPVSHYISFTDEQEWKDEIQRRMNNKFGSSEKDNFVAMKVLPAVIKTTINVEIGVDK